MRSIDIIKKTNKKYALSAVFFAILSVSCSFFIASDSSYADTPGFIAGNIISDSIFTNSNSMNASQIQQFLNSKVSSCDTYGTQPSEFGGGTRAQWAAAHGYYPPFTCLKDYSENGLSSSQIIYNTAQQFQINPQVLIVLLQKEQGLVTDTWPTSNEYQSATGYGCPDSTPGVCSSQYYGFTNQVQWAARMFHAIETGNSSWYTPYLLGNNYIQYSPNASCGGSNVNIQNRATQALYNYTPYQPNQAALNASMGMTVNCGAYGNINFYRYFTQWFGTTNNEISIERTATDPTEYVVYDNQRQGIPTPDILTAWGLSNLPVYTVDSVALNAIPNTGVLTRVIRNPLNPTMLLLGDSGGFFNAWPSMIQDYGIDPNSATTVGSRLLTLSNWSTNLTPFYTVSGGTGAVYVADNGSSHEFSTGTLLGLWAGSSPNIVTLSSNFSSQLTTSTGVFTNQGIDSSGRNIFADNGSLYTIPAGSVANLVVGSPLSISSNLGNLLPQSGNLGQLIQLSGDSTVYLVDSGKLHGFTSGSILQSFLNGGVVNIISPAAATAFTQSTPISNRFITNASTNSPYYLNSFLGSLSQNFGASSVGTSLNANTIAAYPTQPLDCGTGSGFIQGSASATIYMLEGGKKRPIPNISSLLMLDTSGKVCTLNQTDVDSIPVGDIVTPFVQNGSSTYLLEGSNRYSIDANTLSSLGVTPTSTTSTTLSFYNDAGPFSSTFKTDSNQYIYVNGGGFYSTTNPTVASLWSINSTQNHSSNLLGLLKNSGTLSQFASSKLSTNTNIYLVDSGKFIPVSTMNGLINAGYTNQSIPRIDDSTIQNNSSTYVWQGYIASNGSSNWALDGGIKRLIPTQYSNAWNTASSTQLSSGFLSLLPTGNNVTNAIQVAGQSTIYGLKSGNKYGIPSVSVYNQSGLGSTVLVNPSVMSLIPNGGVWSN